MLAILHDDSAELIVAGICETFKWQVVVWIGKECVLGHESFHLLGLLMPILPNETFLCLSIMWAALKCVTILATCHNNMWLHQERNMFASHFLAHSCTELHWLFYSRVSNPWELTRIPKIGFLDCPFTLQGIYCESADFQIA
jgi:hypothetical protein